MQLMRLFTCVRQHACVVCVLGVCLVCAWWCACCVLVVCLCVLVVVFCCVVCLLCVCLVLRQLVIEQTDEDEVGTSHDRQRTVKATQTAHENERGEIGMAHELPPKPCHGCRRCCVLLSLLPVVCFCLRLCFCCVVVLCCCCACCFVV